MTRQPHRASWHPTRPTLGWVVDGPLTLRALRICAGVSARAGYGGCHVVALPDVPDPLPAVVVLAAADSPDRAAAAERIMKAQATLTVGPSAPRYGMPVPGAPA